MEYVSRATPVGGGDHRPVATSIDDDDRGHPSDEIAEIAENPESNGLVVGVTDRRVGVREQRIRKFVSGLPLLDAVDRFRNDR